MVQGQASRVGAVPRSLSGHMLDGWKLGGVVARLGAVVTLGSLVLCGCGAHDTYRVRRGDTLSAISARFGISVAELARANGLADPNCIFEGQELRIPKRTSGKAHLNVAVAVDGTSMSPRVVRRIVGRWRGQLVWPVPNGEVSSSYGPRSGAFHTGVDIAAPAGSDVLAAADGEVVFAGELRGYGLTLIVLHKGGLSTLYAHNHKNLVREGDRVKQGQRIARVGDTGRTTGPNLHFEVRYNSDHFDPLLLLPSRAVAEPRRPSAWGG